MANSNAGRLFSLDAFGVTNLLRYNGAAISGAPSNKLFDTWEWNVIDYQRINTFAVSGQFFSFQKPFPKIATSLLNGISVPVQLVVVPGAGGYSLYPQALSYNGTKQLPIKTVLSGVPYPAWVLVYPQDNLAFPVRGGYTDGVTGLITFTGLAAGTYLIQASDRSGTYNSVEYAWVQSQ